MIKYTRTGGFAGQEDKLTIQKDGKVQFTSKISGNLVHDLQSKLKPNTVRRLVSLLAEINFFSLENEYTTKIPAFDRIVHIITFYNKDQIKKITFETEAKTPKGLRLIQIELEGVITKLISNE